MILYSYPVYKTNDMTGITQNIFIDGAIPASLISGAILQQGKNRSTGAYSLFLGQVRQDGTEGSRVKAIEYTAHTGMANRKFDEIRASLVSRFQISSLFVYHSLGTVQAGEICFFVLAASGHRKEAINACNEAVERVKSELAIWGKLILENDTVKWKENQ
jgi:molybdopterin synthase catalytic subunit